MPDKKPQSHLADLLNFVISQDERAALSSGKGDQGVHLSEFERGVYRQAVEELNNAKHAKALEIVRAVTQPAGTGETSPHSYPFFLLTIAYILWEAEQLGLPTE